MADVERISQILVAAHTRDDAPPNDDNEFDFRVVKDGNEAKISINAIRKDGQFRNKLDAQVRVIGPDQACLGR